MTGVQGSVLPDAMVHLAKLVRAMRAAQQEYYRSRDIAALGRSRKLERTVDEEVRRILDMPDGE